MCRWEEQLLLPLPLTSLVQTDQEALIFLQVINNISDMQTSNLDSDQKLQKEKLRNYDSQTRFHYENTVDINPLIHEHSSKQKNLSAFKKMIPNILNNQRVNTLAWAFLKVRSSDNHLNIGEHLRLQLFYPRKTMKVTERNIYSWWKSGFRRKYPSSIHISLFETALPRPIARNADTIPNLKHDRRSKLDNCQGLEGAIATNAEKAVEWSRKHCVSCVLPNTEMHQIAVPVPGCLCVKFSNNGLRLACAAFKTLHVYKVISGDLVCSFDGHLRLIYDISWKMNDEKIVTASADSTARIWDLKSNSPNKQHILMHPSYVYVAKWMPNGENLVCTGCFDHLIRIWDLIDEYECIQEISEHYGFISAICFNTTGSIMYSGDQKGIIKSWKVKFQESNEFNQHDQDIIYPVNEVRINGILGNIINSLEFHSGGHRLLVHTRDSQLRLINNKLWKTTHILQGPLNLMEQVRGCLSPCGRWVLAGGEDATLMAWNSDTGDLASLHMNLPFTGTISCVDFHPHDNIIALSSHDPASPSCIVIMIHKADKQEANSVPVTVQPITRPANNYSDELPTLDHPHQRHSWKEVGESLLTKLDVVLSMAVGDNSSKQYN